MKNKKMKVSRNEPCPCGSGLKYKKCCLKGDQSGARDIKEIYFQKHKIRLKEKRDVDGIVKAGRLALKTLDLVELNIYERTATDAQLAVITAEADFFSAVADYRAALSLDPLQTPPDQVPNPPTTPGEPSDVMPTEPEANAASDRQR